MQPNSGNAIVPAAKKSNDDIYRDGVGIISQSCPLFLAPSSSALGSQTIYAVAVPYRAGQIVTNLGFNVVVAGSGTVPTSIFVGLCNATTMLMDSGNLASSTAWTTTGLRTVALTSAYTIPTSGLYYHLILENGAFASTAMTLGRLNSASAQINAAGTFFYATAGTSQTALPSVSGAVTLASSGSPSPWTTFST